MDHKEVLNSKQADLVDKAVAGDQAALEELLGSVRDTIFNLSLRMLSTIPDAEDATQEISVKIMTHLSTFRKESAFSTWVYRIAVNHLNDCKTHRFANAPFSFEMYGADICDKRALEAPDMSGGVDRDLLERELKLSCTNVMLQCLDSDARCAYVLGTMFKINSELAAEIIGITPDAYRQRFSRARKTVAEFLGAYCGHGGSDAWSCARRVNFAVITQRLEPNNLEYLALDEADDGRDASAAGHAASTESATQKRHATNAEAPRCAEDTFIAAMDQLDGYSCLFDTLPSYRSTLRTRELLAACMQSDSFDTVMHTQATPAGR